MPAAERSPAERFSFEKVGQTWVCTYHELASWPIALSAHKVYHGTQREIATLSLSRVLSRTKQIVVVTSRVDMLVAAQIRSFAKEAGTRLAPVLEGNKDSIEPSIIAMVDALRLHLLNVDQTIELLSASDIVLPKDLAPRYTLWPIVPMMRPGMLVGPSGMGKSTAAQAFGLSVVTGALLLPGIEPRSQGPVFYIGQEEDAQQWAVRLEMICRGHKLIRPKAYYYIKLRGGSLIDSAEILAEMAAKQGVSLIIIDSAQATWGGGEDNVREYASSWYNAVEVLGVPVLVIEHPNLADTRKTNANGGFAAGSSVKRDRVGHAWSLRSVNLPAQEGQPTRYHVTLSDVKRNYVSKQADITFETTISGHEWLRFQQSGALTADTIIGVASKLAQDIATKMRQSPAEDQKFGFTTDEMAAFLNLRDDARVAKEMRSAHWRIDRGNKSYEYSFERTGGGTRTDPYRYRLVTRDREEDEGPEMEGPPGNDAYYH